MPLSKEDNFQNVNILANAIEMVANTASRLNSNDVRKTVNGNGISDSSILHDAIAARLQRRVQKHDFR